MFNVGGGEVLVIAVLALVVLGPDRLPQAARTVGRHLADARRIRDGFRGELDQVLGRGESPAPAPTAEPAPAAAPAPSAPAAGRRRVPEEVR
jgi:sec-independent protein translocase protein TatB